MAENAQFLRSLFGMSADYYEKELVIGGIRCRIVMFTGLSSPEKLTVMALSLLEQERRRFADGAALVRYLLTSSRIPAESEPGRGSAISVTF